MLSILPHPKPSLSSSLPVVPVDNFTSAIILYTHTMFTYLVVCDYLKSRTLK